MQATALVLEQPRSLVPRTVDLPETGDDDGLLRVEACGLCGTDHEQFTGVMAPGYPFIPGHEAVGVIERLGDSAAERWGVREGDRVAVAVFQSCGECRRCRAGRQRECQRHGIRDMYGFIPADKPPVLWGGYANYQYLSPDSMLIPVPDGIPPEMATLFNPLGAGIRWGVNLPGTGEGDVVAILGPGIRGLCAAAAAKNAGARFVMITGAGRLDGDRLSLAARFGADLAVDVNQRDPVGALRETAGRLADVVVDVTAKAPAAFAQAIALARPGGTVVVAGTRGGGGTPGFSPDLVVFKELRILGALGVDVSDYVQAFELLSAGKFPFDELPRRCVGFDELPELLGVMAGDDPSEPSGARPVHGVLVPN